MSGESNVIFWLKSRDIEPTAGARAGRVPSSPSAWTACSPTTDSLARRRPRGDAHLVIASRISDALSAVRDRARRLDLRHPGRSGADPVPSALIPRRQTTASSTTKTTTSKTTTTGKSTTGKPPTKRPAKAQSAGQDARRRRCRAPGARELETPGAYGPNGRRAARAACWVKPDATSRLALASTGARVGRIDSARNASLGPLMQASVLETLPLTRRREYPYQREFGWLDGRSRRLVLVHLARARELGATGPGTGTEGCGRAAVRERAPTERKGMADPGGAPDASARTREAHAAARQALDLDPTLPETRYLVGLWEWRAGRRGEASTPVPRGRGARLGVRAEPRSG